MKNGVPRILVIRLSAIGDVVRVLPALAVLRRAYPDARLDWAVERKSAGVLEGHPGVDRVMVYERSQRLGRATVEFVRFCRMIQRERYDIVVDFHGALKSGLIAAASRAPKRWGFAPPRARDGSHWAVHQHVALPHGRMNRVDENLLLAGSLVETPLDIEGRLHAPEALRGGVDLFMDGLLKNGKRVIAMHAPVDRPEKQWPLEHYAALGDLLLADGRFEVMLTWGPGQRALAEQVAALMERTPILAPETRGLLEYAWLVGRAHAYVGGDTGPMHIAWMMGVPVVALFGGTDPLKHAPWKAPCEVLYAGDPAAGPPSERLAEARRRLEAITPEMAYEACRRLSLGE